MSFLTVFSAPKPFSDPHIAIIQTNALQSWLHLGSEVEVFLVGEEPGLAEAAEQHGVPLLQNVQRNTSGTPLVSSIFELARQASRSEVMAYVNGDVLLLPDILLAAQQIAAQTNHQPFLLIGQRWDLDVTEPLDFSSGWEDRLKARTQNEGRLHAPAGSDYFVFPRNAFSEMPEFAIGRAGWDNWMIYHARSNNMPVIDGTPSIMIIHQSHDYSHLPGGRSHYNLAESQQNMQLGGGLKHMYMVLDANCQLRDGKIRSPQLSWRRLIRSIELRLMPDSGELRGARGELTRKLRKLRRKMSKET